MAARASARSSAKDLGRIAISLAFILVVTSDVDAEPMPHPPASLTQPGVASPSAPASWSGRSGTSITEQILTRQLFDQIRSLKFAYEDNINQLMRKVDNLDMKMARHSCDYVGIETIVRKIESLDLKVNRLESSNLHRLEELSKNLHTKGIRQELAMDGLIQKVDENHERIKQKLIFAEKRLDTINTKMQVYEGSFVRMESRLTDIDNEISDISNTLDDIKSLSTFIDDKHNNTQRTVKEQLQVMKSESASRQQLEKLSSSVKDIESKLNDTIPMVRDDANVRVSASDSDRSLMMDLKAQISFERMKIEDKISSMYTNLWNRFISLETTAKHLLKIGNITRRQLREDFQSLLQSEARFVEPESQENYMGLILDVLKRMLQEHKEQMDTNLQMSLTSQNLFMDSLNKSMHHTNRNEDLKEMEGTLSSILEKIIYTITNKTSRTDSRLFEVMQMIKDYKTQVMRNLGHLTKMVISLTEEQKQKGKEDKKRFEKGLLDMTEMNEILATGMQDLYEKFDIIANMTPNCEETMKNTAPKSTNGIEALNNQSNTEDNENDSNNTLPNKDPTTGTSKDNIGGIEDDNVIKIFTEDGERIENRNTSYEILNTTNSNHNNQTAKKQISIVIPFDAIDDTEILKSKLQDFLNQLPVSKADAIIVRTNKDLKQSVEEKMQQTNTNIENSEAKTINRNDSVSNNTGNFMEIDISGGNSSEMSSRSSLKSIQSEGGGNNQEIEQKETVAVDLKMSSSNANHTKGEHLKNNITSNKATPLVLNLSNESQTFKPPEEVNSVSQQRKGRSDDLEVVDDLETSTEVNDHGEKKEQEEEEKYLKNTSFTQNSKENTDNSQERAHKVERIVDLMNSFFAPAHQDFHQSTKNLNTPDERPLEDNFSQKDSFNQESEPYLPRIDSLETDLNDSNSGTLELADQEQDTKKSMVGSSSTTLLPNKQQTPSNKNQNVSNTHQNLRDKLPLKRTKQDIRQLFQDMKSRRQQRIHELTGNSKDNKEESANDDVNKDQSIDDDLPSNRQSLDEHFKSFDSSEEMALNKDQHFDLLYDDENIPYSA